MGNQTNPGQSPSVTTTSQTPNHEPKWTVMVFMGADGVEGNKPLGEEAEADIAEMKKLPESYKVGIFVEKHGDGLPVRHYTKGSGWKTEPVTDTDPSSFANGIALTNFLEWALKEASHTEPDNSLLVLWGHSYRFAIGHTSTHAGIDPLDFAELAVVLSKFQEKKRQDWGMKTPPKLDIVGFDACSLATVEMAYQLAPYACYLIASQVGIPMPGWPYDRILERVVSPKGPRVMGPAELGSYVVRRYCEHYRSLDRSVSLSHMKLDHAPTLLRLTEALARALAVAMDDDAGELATVSKLFELAQTADGEPFADVVSLCRLLMMYSSSPQVRSTARALGDAIFSPTSVRSGASSTGECKPFIVEHCRNSCEGAGLHGVSLYAPHVAPGHDFGEASHFYEKFVFARDTLWRELVRAMALPSAVC